MPEDIADELERDAAVHPHTYIEPLDDGRPPGIDDSFIRRRVEQQAAEVVQLSDSRPSRLVIEVTRFHQTALLAVDADGATERVTDTLQPADSSRECHFAFQRVGEPETVSRPGALPGTTPRRRSWTSQPPRPRPPR